MNLAFRTGCVARIGFTSLAMSLLSGGGAGFGQGENEIPLVPNGIPGTSSRVMPTPSTDGRLIAFQRLPPISSRRTRMAQATFFEDDRMLKIPI